jgi:hypothetical protein
MCLKKDRILHNKKSFYRKKFVIFKNKPNNKLYQTNLILRILVLEKEDRQENWQCKEGFSNRKKEKFKTI